MDKAVPRLQEQYGVRISIDAIIVAAGGVRRFAPEMLPEDILYRACETVKENFMNFAHEVGFYEKEYELGQALVELIELYRDDHLESQLWVKRLRAERDKASFYIADFLRKWDFALADSASNISFNRSTTSSTVRQLLDDIQRKLIGCSNDVLTVTDSHVAKVISRLTDVPITLILPLTDAEKKRATYMTMQRVVNQEYAITDIFNVVASPRPVTKRPMGSFILLGPSGVGKKEIAKSVARYWYCDPTRLFEIDMSEYAEPPLVSILSQPRLRVNGDDLLTRLTKVVQRRPYSIFLLRNIDKASSTVVKIILKEVLSAGGNTADFSNTIFFMTANVGSNRFQCSCRCYDDDKSLWEIFSRSPLEFYKNHGCAVKNLKRERVLVEARRIISEELLESVDKLIVMDRIHDQKSVGRLMIRDIIREIYGKKTIVHASNAALEAIFLKARTYVKTHGLEGGTTLRQALLEILIPKLHSLLPGAEGHGNVSVCVDTLVGTSELSFRVQTHEHVVDRYFKLPNGTITNFVANLRLKMEAISKVFILRRRCIDLMDSEQSYSQNYSEVGKLLLQIRGVMSDAFSSPDPSIRLWEETLPSPSPSQRSAFKEIVSSKEKHKFKKFRRELREKDATGIATATITILDALVKMSGASLPSPNLPSRYFIFEGLNNDASMMLISYLKKSLGTSFFTHVKLDDDNCRSGEEVRNMLVDRVKKRPCMVLLIDRVEFADDVLYKSLLEIFDKGTMDDSDGFSVDFQRSIVILTSNVGNKHVIASFLFKHQERALDVGNEDVVRRVRTELFYRMDHVMFFDPISPESGPVRSLSLTKRTYEVEGPYSMLYHYVYAMFKGVFKE